MAVKRSDVDPLKRLEEMEARARSRAAATSASPSSTQPGKLTARERIELLLDPGSFVELDKFVTHRCADFGMEEQKILGDGVVTGYGTVDGRQVFVVRAGLHRLRRLALGRLRHEDLQGDGSGDAASARRSSASTTRAARASRRASSRSPATPTSSCATCWPRAWCRRSRAIMGPCAGGAVYSPAMTDFIFMVENTSYMFITGPDVIKTVTHEEVTKEELGGAHTHAARSGVAALRRRRRARLPRRHPRAALVPAAEQHRGPAGARRREDPRRPRGRRARHAGPGRLDQALRHQGGHHRASSTTGSFFEVQPEYAQNIVVGFARIDGRTGRHRRQPAGAPGRLPRHRRVGQGRALRALLRLLQHPAGHLRRRARLPARHRPGVRRHHQARRQAALRLRRGDGAQGHGHHPQGLRRRLRRDGVASTSAPTSTSPTRPPRSR